MGLSRVSSNSFAVFRYRRGCNYWSLPIRDRRAAESAGRSSFIQSEYCHERLENDADRMLDVVPPDENELAPAIDVA